MSKEIIDTEEIDRQRELHFLNSVEKNYRQQKLDLLEKSLQMDGEYKLGNKRDIALLDDIISKCHENMKILNDVGFSMKDYSKKNISDWLSKNYLHFSFIKGG